MSSAKTSLQVELQMEMKKLDSEKNNLFTEIKNSHQAIFDDFKKKFLEINKESLEDLKKKC